MNNKSSLILSLYQIGAIQFGDFTLKSGQQSTVYINLRKIISYPDVLRSVAEAMWHTISHCQFDLVCGVPYTALPIATTLSLSHNIPMIMRRKEKKDYGTKQSIEGKFKKGQRCLVIEDVMTTGSSILETTHELEEAGLIIHDVVVLMDREADITTLSSRYHLHAIITLSEALNTLLQSAALSPSEQECIKQFLSKHKGRTS